MTRESISALLGFLCLLPAVGSGMTSGHAKPSAKAGTSTAQKKVKPGTATASKAASGKSARGGATTTHLVRTKSGRLVRVKVHAPPAPSFQTHPDPDRYAEIQKALADRGYFKGEPNGQWGDDSVDALKRFQAGTNLPDDGKISALTLNGLGLGPRHDGTTASTVPLASAPASGAPTVVEESVGPAASAPAPQPASPAPSHPPLP